MSVLSPYIERSYFECGISAEPPPEFISLHERTTAGRTRKGAAGVRTFLESTGSPAR